MVPKGKNALIGFFFWCEDNLIYNGVLLSKSDIDETLEHARTLLP